MHNELLYHINMVANGCRASIIANISRSIAELFYCVLLKLLTTICQGVKVFGS